MKCITLSCIILTREACLATIVLPPLDTMASPAQAGAQQPGTRTLEAAGLRHVRQLLHDSSPDPEGLPEGVSGLSVRCCLASALLVGRSCQCSPIESLKMPPHLVSM